MHRPSLIARGLDALLGGYQRHLSPLFGPTCRFHPSCSQYARRALATEPFWRALWLTGRRLLRCQPLFQGGDDPVPADRIGACAHPPGDAT